MGLRTTRQAAERLGLSVFTLEAWRVRGGGPVYVKLGKAVRYSDQELDNFEKASERTNTSQIAGAVGLVTECVAQGGQDPVGEGILVARTEPLEKRQGDDRGEASERQT